MCQIMELRNKMGKSPLAIFGLATIWAGSWMDEVELWHHEWLIEGTIPQFVSEYCQESLKKLSNRNQRKRRH